MGVGSLLTKLGWPFFGFTNFFFGLTIFLSSLHKNNTTLVKYYRQNFKENTSQKITKLTFVFGLFWEEWSCERQIDPLERQHHTADCNNQSFLPQWQRRRRRRVTNKTREKYARWVPPKTIKSLKIVPSEIIDLLS